MAKASYDIEKIKEYIKITYPYLDSQPGYWIDIDRCQHNICNPHDTSIQYLHRCISIINNSIPIIKTYPAEVFISLEPIITSKLEEIWEELHHRAELCVVY